MTFSGAVDTALPAAEDVVAAADGDVGATRRVLAAVAPFAVRYSRGRLGRGAVADDVAGEIVGRVSDLLARHRPVGRPFGAVVYRTAVTVADGVAGRCASPVGDLPAELREMLVLRVAAGLTVGQVAELTGLSPGTVRVRQHRALAALRSWPADR